MVRKFENFRLRQIPPTKWVPLPGWIVQLDCPRLGQMKDESFSIMEENQQHFPSCLTTSSSWSEDTATSASIGIGTITIHEGEWASAGTTTLTPNSYSQETPHPTCSMASGEMPTKNRSSIWPMPMHSMSPMHTSRRPNMTLRADSIRSATRRYQIWRYLDNDTITQEDGLVHFQHHYDLILPCSSMCHPPMAWWSRSRGQSSSMKTPGPLPILHKKHL